MTKLLSIAAAILLVGCAQTNTSTNKPPAARSAAAKVPEPLGPTPNEPSAGAFNRILERAVAGGSLQSSWCKKDAILKSDLFAFRTFKVLETGARDQAPPNGQGDWLTLYTARIESSNRGGSPIVKDWHFALKFSELVGGGTGWCVSMMF